MGKTQIRLKNMERNGNGEILELEVWDPETKQLVRLVRSDDIHGDEKNVRIKFTDGSKINGTVNMSKYKRVSDLFAYGKRFQPVFNATADGGDNLTLFLNKDQVVWAEEVNGE